MLTYFYAVILICCCLTTSGCQSLAVKITQHLMDNDATERNVQALNRYADAQITRPLQVDADIFYGSKPEERLDVIYPHGEPSQRYPIIFLVHGGGWVAGNKQSMLPYAKLLAAEGFVVANIEYSLVPQQAFPTQLTQLNLAIAYIKQHAQRWPVDLDHSFLSGDSAGANIVSSYAALINSPILLQQLGIIPQLAPQQLKGIVVHSGVYDLTRLYRQGQQASWAYRWIITGVLDAYAGESPASQRTLYAMSALPWLTSAYPPVWVSASDNDLLTQGQSLPFIERLHALNVPITAHIYPKSWPEPLNHDFEFTMSYRASQQVFAESVAFMKGRVGEKNLALTHQTQDGKGLSSK